MHRTRCPVVLLSHTRILYTSVGHEYSSKSIRSCVRERWKIP